MVKIIHDEEQVRRFLEKFIGYESTKMLTLTLMSRRKYQKDAANAKKIEFQRLHFTSLCTIDDMIREIRKLELALPAYASYMEGCPLVIYAAVNLTDILRGFHYAHNEIIEASILQQPMPNIVDTINRRLSKFPCKKYSVCDIDTKDPAMIKNIKEMMVRTGMSEPIEMEIETHGGYHVILSKNDKIDTKAVHDFSISTMFGRDGLPPDKYFSVGYQCIVPGTMQADFEAKLCNVFGNG